MREFAVVALALLAASFVVALSAQTTPMLLAVSLLVPMVVYLAYRHPLTTVALLFVLQQITGAELSNILPLGLATPDLGFMFIRHDDPIMFGIVCAMLLKLLTANPQLGRFLFRDHLPWTMFMVWIGFEVVRLVGSYGINAVGEFRTYYGQLLIVPYIYVFFRDERDQWRLFRVLVALSASMVGVGLFRAGLQWSLEGELSLRLMTATGNLALLNGVIALTLAHKLNLGLLRDTRLSLLLFVFFAVTFFAHHRSVWLAAAVAYLAINLLVKGRAGISAHPTAAVAAAAAVAAVAYITVFTTFDPALYLQEKLLAFTAAERDPTASWRLQLWALALERVSAQPLIGLGIGQSFQFVTYDDVLITTSPHNLYITVAFHAGAVGLLLYVVFAATAALRLKSCGRTATDRQRVMASTGLVVLISSSAYYSAYVLDLSTWLYVGTALAAAAAARRSAAPAPLPPPIAAMRNAKASASPQPGHGA